MKRVLTLLFRAITVMLPWGLKRRALVRCCKYDIDPSARIGLSWVFPDRLTMERGSRIGHLNVAIHLAEIRMGEETRIGRGNWITGYPKAGGSHFTHLPERNPALIVDAHAAITKNHHLDCTDTIHVGAFTTVAGYRSQLLTHSINIEKGIQDAKPITIGRHCFIGTNVVMLGGAVLSDCSVLGAQSMLSKKIHETHQLVGGVPAKAVKTLDPDYKYFTREAGFVE